MECAGCHNDKPIKARGLCARCYTRWQKTGSVEYLRWGKKKATCSIDGCETEAKAGGLCPKHYQRQKKHGHTDITRGFFPAEWGNIRVHPSFAQWEAFRRLDGPRTVVTEWREDFPAFVAGVGERPSSSHRLYSVNKLLPLGPGNFEWRLPVTSREEGEDVPGYRRRYRRAHKAAFPDLYTDLHYRGLYGIGEADYQLMAAKQNHCCAICRHPEAEERTGKVRRLAVDHNHETCAVRGLLCQSCNKMIGYARDKPSRLYAAIAYLIQHGTDPAA